MILPVSDHFSLYYFNINITYKAGSWYSRIKDYSEQKST